MTASVTFPLHSPPNHPKEISIQKTCGDGETLSGADLQAGKNEKFPQNSKKFKLISS